MTWQSEWQQSLRSADDLREWGFISQAEVASYEKLLKRYSFVLPTYYANLISKNDPSCPIRKQAIPQLIEDKSGVGLSDPLSDLQHQPVPHITRRYARRVLLHLTTNCSMVCRYCFRKSLLNEFKEEFISGSLNLAFEYLTQHEEINEVIFSGGDPLMVGDPQIERIVQKLSRLDHIRRIRFHTRVPVTFPSRITDELLAATRTSKKLIWVCHFNHSSEVTEASRAAVERLKKSGTVFNQAVLLKGVNDSVETLTQLHERLFDTGVIPYYLHFPDQAAGTEHFFVSRERALAIYDKLRQALPGYLVPKLVVDVVGEKYKRALNEVEYSDA